MRFLFTVVFAVAAHGAVTNLQQVGSTPTQIIISFTADDPASCTIEASTASGYTPLALDVDTAYYAGASACNRAGNVVQGKHVFAVIGKQGADAVDTASNGLILSRALRADTGYYIRVTSGDNATLVARTANVPNGIARGEQHAVAAPFKWKRISRNPRLVPEFIDPYTGVLTKNVAELFGWSYTASTSKSNIHADCNQTLTGFDSSCKFTDATGTNWTATTGTLTDAVRADDSNYAEYSGTSQDVLVLRLGTPRLGVSSSVGNSTTQEISFQNIGLRGQTSTTAGGGGEIETCLVMDIGAGLTCDSPWITTTLTTSDSTIRICRDSPCSNADQAGDWMTYDNPERATALSSSRMYNEVGSLDVMKLAGDGAVSDCNKVRAGEGLYVYKTSNNTGYSLTVSSKDCGASPPTVTVSPTNVDLTHNGTRGVGWYRSIGINSENYALLIRKKSTTSGSTIKIGYVLWRAAWSYTDYLNDKSGGFGQKCQVVPTNDGYYLCNTPQGVVGLKNNGDGFDLRYYGTLWIRPQFSIGGLPAGIASQQKLCGNYTSADFAWDLTTPGKFYCNFISTYPNPYKGGTVDNRTIVAAVQMSLAVPSAPDPDGGTDGLTPEVQTTITNLTPCLNSCTVEADDYTPFGQMMKFTSGWTEPRVPWDTRYWSPGCGSMINATTLGCGYRIGEQETPQWSMAFDLGNGLPIGSGYVGSSGNTYQIVAAMQYNNNVAGRHCSVHTSQLPITLTGSPFTIPEVSTSTPSRPAVFYTQQTNTLSACSTSSAPGTCTSCDTLLSGGNLTLDGYNYSGKNFCSLLQVTSTWPSGVAHARYETGDPVQANGVEGNTTWYFDQKLRRGDYIGRSGETMRILQKNSATEYVVARGWGTMVAGGSAPSHSAGVSWGTVCYNRRYNTPDLANLSEYHASIVWYPLLDPDGWNANYTFLSDLHNHAHYSFGYGTFDKWKAVVLPGYDPAAHKAAYVNQSYVSMSIPNSFSFAGKSAFVVGNAVEYHPGGQHVRSTETPWFHDINPRLFHTGITNSTTVSQVAGKTNIFKLGGGGANFVNPKHFDIEAFSDRFPLQRADTLTDDGAGRGKWCVAIKADDCFSGSTAGFYFSSDIYDTTFNGAGSQDGCFESEFGGQGLDICGGNIPGFIGVTQTRYPSSATSGTIRNGLHTRVVKLENMLPRPAATINAMSDPLGISIIPRDMPQYVVLPKFNALRPDAVTFRAVPVVISSAPAGTANALVQFGHNAAFQCTRNRDNTCYAESATLNETTPFVFDHETLTGVSCGSGCTISVPAIAGKTLYYRIVFRNAGGAVISRSATQVVAVN